MSHTRTDIHSPKHLITEDYEFLGCGNFPTAEVDGYSPLMRPDAQALLDDGWRFADVETNGCQHCGAFLIYYAVLKHLPTKTFLRVGEQCLDNRFSLATVEFQRLRKQAALDRAQQRIKTRRNEWLAESTDREVAWAFANERVSLGDYGWDGFRHNFVSIINRKGETSDKFVAAILRDKARTEEREAEKQAEQATASPVETGKQVITGRVLTTKVQDGYYGSTMKMLVADDRGFKVWGTAPEALFSHLETLEFQDSYKAMLKAQEVRVRFNATVEASDDDPSFGFFKRPTKLEVV